MIRVQIVHFDLLAADWYEFLVYAHRRPFVNQQTLRIVKSLDDVEESERDNCITELEDWFLRKTAVDENEKTNCMLK